MPKVDKVLKVKPVPVPPGYQHPEPPNPVLPKHEVNFLIYYFFIFLVYTWTNRVSYKRNYF
jgi:hypothetical protein